MAVITDYILLTLPSQLLFSDIQPVAACSASPEDLSRGMGYFDERSPFSARDRLVDQAAAAMTAAPMRHRSAHEWATTPPFPTPALTASSLSSSSFFGERSPVLSPASLGSLIRRTYDNPCMTTMFSERSSDDVASPSCFKKDGKGDRDHNASTQSPRCNGLEGDMGSLSSSFAALNLFNQQSQDASRSPDVAPHHMASSLGDLRPAAPLLIPMQPTGAGVPLTSVVETLASKGSKAAAEDPATLAAAFKLKEWGIG